MYQNRYYLLQKVTSYLAEPLLLSILSVVVINSDTVPIPKELGKTYVQKLKKSLLPIKK